LAIIIDIAVDTFVFSMKRIVFLRILLSFGIASPIGIDAQILPPQKDTLFVNGPGEYQAYKHLYIYKADKPLSPEFVYDSIKAPSFIPLYPNRSFNNTTSLIPYYWLLLTVKNDQPNDETFYYWLNSPGLTRVNAYRKTAGGNFRLEGVGGFYTPIYERQNKGHDAEFRFMIRKGESAVLLLLVENTAARNAFFYPQFSDADTFRSKQEHYYLVMGIIAGIMAISFLLNIFFAITLRENIHYLYAAYIAGLLYEIFTLEGFIDVYSGSGYRTTDLLTHISPPICSLLMTRIMQWFLNQKRSNSIFRLPLDISSGILLLNAILYILNYLFGFKPSVTNFIQIMQALGVGIQMILVILSAVEKTLQRYRLAWLYLAATLWLLVGIFEYVLGFLGFNDIELIKKRHPNDLQIGLVVESVVVFVAIIYRYNLYKKEKERLLLEMAGQQEQLIQGIVAAEEEERRRIAADLHDDVGATLGTLVLHISSKPGEGSTDNDLEQYYRRGLQLSHKAAGDIRAIAHNLMPKDFRATGLFLTLQTRIAELNALTKISFSVVTEGEENRLNEGFSVFVYRIINELLTNIVRHSVASSAIVQLLIEPDAVQIMTEDDGIGFDQATGSKGLGLKNIAGRVEFLKGSLQIDSGKKGTTTIIRLPV
jgi:signal transduction histidine kinase